MGELRRTTSSIEIWEWRKDTRNAIGLCAFSDIVRDSIQFVTHLYPHSSWLIHLVCDFTTPNAIGLCTANPTWGDISECCCQAQSPKLERLFCYVSVKRDIRALSFELWNSFRKCHTTWDWLYIYGFNSAYVLYSSWLTYRNIVRDSYT